MEQPSSLLNKQKNNLIHVLFVLKHFSNNSHLIRHTKTHVLTDSFECDDCGEKFSQKDNLQTHVRNHHLKTFDDVNTIHFKQKLKNEHGLQM